jgi:hypothetical protein
MMTASVSWQLWRCILFLCLALSHRSSAATAATLFSRSILPFSTRLFQLQRSSPLVGQSLVEETPCQNQGREHPVEIHCEVDGTPVVAMIDTGAELSVLSSRWTDRSHLTPRIDTSFAGKAIGVGSGQILGRLTDLPVRIGPIQFKTPVAVLKNSRVDMIIGLDLLRRFRGDVNFLDDTLRLHVKTRQVKIPFIRSRKTEGGSSSITNRGMDTNAPSDTEKSSSEVSLPLRSLILDQAASAGSTPCSSSDRYCYLYTNAYNSDSDGKVESKIAGFDRAGAGRTVHDFDKPVTVRGALHYNGGSLPGRRGGGALQEGGGRESARQSAAVGGVDTTRDEEEMVSLAGV